MSVLSSAAIKLITESRAVSYSEGAYYHSRVMTFQLIEPPSAVASVTLLTWDVIITLSDEVRCISLSNDCIADMSSAYFLRLT